MGTEVGNQERTLPRQRPGAALNQMNESSPATSCVLRISELKLPLDHTEADLRDAICQKLRIPSDSLRSHRLVKRSVDARRQDAIELVYSLDLDLELDGAARGRLLKRKGNPKLRIAPDSHYQFVRPPGSLTPPPHSRPVVVGAGPCGYFAALVLAQMGLRPLLLERGKPVKERTADTFGFWKGQRHFDPSSNAQFGEGGAGTFSDGKLYSQVSESERYIRKVLEELVAAGANPEILTQHHPHIGTFKLATVVRGLRARIEALGGEIRFLSLVSSIELTPCAENKPGNGTPSIRRVVGVRLANGMLIPTDHVVLAIGHSARDTFAMLDQHGVAMEAKPFAIGLRIEHPQKLIDQARWGKMAGHPRLNAAEYKLVHHTSAGRDVYSFCMCPGGLVVGATSEPGCVVTNGMSQHSRNDRNANSGLVVNITTNDLDHWKGNSHTQDPLVGISFQRHWEHRAFEAGGGDYRAPAQWVDDFMLRRPSTENRADGVKGSFMPGTRLGSLENCLPGFVLEAIREALPKFERKLPGFIMPNALLTGVETRTSSPVRIPRDSSSRQSINTVGLYPAGEGAGYAGGILSAAIDGIKVAESIAVSLFPHPHKHQGVPT